MGGQLDSVRRQVDDLSKQLDRDEDDRILSDYSIASVVIDLFNAIWPVTAAAEEWFLKQSGKDATAKALMKAVSEADGYTPEPAALA